MEQGFLACFWRSCWYQSSSPTINSLWIKCFSCLQTVVLLLSSSNYSLFWVSDESSKQGKKNVLVFCVFAPPRVRFFFCFFWGIAWSCYCGDFFQGLHPCWGLAQKLLNWFFFFFLQCYTDDKEKRSYTIYWLCWIHLLLFKEQEAREPPETGNPLWSLFYKAAYSAAAEAAGAAASQPPVQDWFCVKRLCTGCGEVSTQQYENKVRQSKTSIVKSHSQNAPGSPRQETAWKKKRHYTQSFYM